jgi:hypothetical protein
MVVVVAGKGYLTFITRRFASRLLHKVLKMDLLILIDID